MTWTKIPDSWNTTAYDVLGLSNEAEILHIRILVHCNVMLSDGFIPDRSLERFLFRFDDPESLIRQLIGTGLWQRVKGGYQLDWADQEAASTVRKRQEANRLRQQKFRARGQELKEKRLERQDAELEKKLDRRERQSHRDERSTRTVPSRPVPLTGTRDEDDSLRSDRIAAGAAPALAALAGGWKTIGPLKIHSNADGLLLRWERDDEIAEALDESAIESLYREVLSIMNQWVDRMMALGFKAGDDDSGVLGADQYRILDFPEGASEHERAEVESRALTVLRELAA